MILQRQYKTYQIFFQKWLVILLLSANFLHGFFHCDLPEDTIDVEITVRILKGIHIFRKNHGMQSSVCSSWGSAIKSFPSLCRKMATIIRERQIIFDPFHSHQSFPSGPKPSLLSNLPKATHKRKRSTKAIPRKAKKNYIPNKRATFATLPKERQLTVTVLVMVAPAMVAATPNLPVTPNPPQNTERATYCET